MNISDLDPNSQFIKDLVTIENADRNYNMGMMNLILSIRDLELFCKGIKPNRYWKFTPLKKYFGIKGNKEAMLKQLKLIKELIDGGDDE